MQTEFLSILIVGVFVIAVLYSAVGHAGASGYIAVMSLLSLAPTEIKPTALMLNILVGSIAAWQFYRAGHFSWTLFWPFAVLAVPFAFIGGAINLPSDLFKTILGMVLLYSALRFVVQSTQSTQTHSPAMWAALTSGAVIGLLSGLTGTGGAIFLTPLMLFNGWAEPKRAAAVSALFVLLNSAAGLAGFMTGKTALPSYLAPLLLAAAAGGTVGAYLGSRRVQAATIKQLLSIVLLIAGLKLIFT